VFVPNAMPDHVDLLLSIPPKYSVANTVGFVKGKSAIQIHRQYLGRQGAELHRVPLLGARLLREHRRPG
jgi:REP element-mobilizing transposase RayT